MAAEEIDFLNYAEIERRLNSGAVVILDGGTGTELQRRGVPMHPGAWCGPASLENAAVLEEIHRDYINSGADVITANTYASSRLMLDPVGFGDRFEEINRSAIHAAHRARETSARENILVAGSLSHMAPLVRGTARADLQQAPAETAMADAFAELATLLRDEACDLVVLEMMYYPERMGLALKAATATGLPVWAGLSARRDEQGRVLSFAQDTEIPFQDLVQVLNDFDVKAAGIMHTPSHVVADAISILRSTFTGPLMAYPDSGYFKMPQWQFEDIIAPDDFLRFATEWGGNGVQIIGGCCGLSPEHIAVLRPLKDRKQRKQCRT